tara:strand:- start:482 stop:2764 length:2283 start_codon:yes stop_codon:yes gene_type:complete
MSIDGGKKILRLIALAALALTSINLAAQEQEPVIEEVIVFGQKYERSLQDTPQSASIVGALTIEEENLLSLSDVLYRTANAASTFSGTGFSLRGVRNDNVSGGGFADLATIFLDGAPLPRDATLSGTLDIWDVQQVEVLRGPQSTLQGRNSLAGAVVLQTTDPSQEWEGKVRVQTLSEIEENRYSVAFGGPIIQDQLAFRIAAEKSKASGSVTNITRKADSDYIETDYMRAKLLITPDAIPELRMTLSYLHDDRDFGDRNSLMDSPSSWDERLVRSNRLAFDRTENDIFIANASYELSDTFDLTWIATHSASERFRELDGDVTAEDSEFSTSQSETKTTTSELRLSFTSDRLTGVTGLWYSDIDNDPNLLTTRFSFDVIEQFQLPLLLQGAPFFLDAGTAGFAANFYTDPFLLDADLVTLQQVKTMALFADMTYQITDQLDLLAGFRFDREEQDLNSTQSVVVASALPNPALGGPAAPILTGINAFLQAQADTANTPGVAEESEYSNFLPKLGVSYALADNQTLSFFVQKGFRSGGVSGNAARVTIVPYDAESTWNYELSYRSQWLDRKVTLNGNLYFTDWTDQQVNVFLSSNSYDSEVQNAGASELKGFEIESSYTFSSNVSVYASMGYADTEFTDFFVNFDGTPVDRSGNEFSHAPRWTMAAGFTFNNEAGWIVNVNANHTGDSFNSATEQENGKELPERTLVNFRAGWSNNSVGVYLIGRNVFDNVYFDSDFTDANGNNITRWGQPQMFGLTLEANL